MLPLGVAVVAIPPLVRGLGAERFSILTLAATAIGYFGLFEFGLGRALTQGVAERLGTAREDDLPSFAWTGFALLAALGIVAAVVMAASSQLLVTRVLNVPAALQGEVTATFQLLALALPAVITTAGMRGVMEAHHHFGVVNALRVPLVAFTFAGPLLVLPFSRSLVPAVSVLVAGRLVGWLLHAVYCLRSYPYLRHVRLNRAWIRPLVRFGGWTAVTNVVGPIMVHLDRFYLAAILPLAAVAHYVTPFEVVTKLLFVSAAIAAAVFPAFAATHSSDPARMQHLYDRSIRTVLIAVFPMVLVSVGLAHEGLRAWMGSALPPESAVVLQWLAVGILINAIAQAPFVALQGAGRPDLVARAHLVELPLYVALLVLLTREFGLVGAAAAWTLRVTVDTIVLLVLAWRTLGVPLKPRRGVVWSTLAMFASLGGAAAIADTGVRIVYLGVVLIAFLVVVRNYLLRATERQALWTWLRAPASTPTASEELA